MGSSKEEACLVMRTLRRLNRALVVNQKRIDYFRCRNDFQGGKHCKQESGFKDIVELYSPNVGERNTSDDLTSLTFSEFQKNVVEKINQFCPEGEDPSPRCLKELKVVAPAQQDQRMDREERDKKLLAEYQIQTAIMQKGIDKYDSEEIKEEIIAEGGEMEKIVDSVENQSQGQIEKLREEMRKRHEEERKASLKALAKRLTNPGMATAGEEEKISNSAIVESIRAKNKDLGQLLFFNNIITGYLGVEEPDINGEEKELRRNLSSFRREIEQVEDGNLPNSLQQDFVDDLTKRLAELEAKENKDPAASNTTYLHSKFMKKF